MSYFRAKSLDAFLEEMSKKPSPTYIGWELQTRDRDGTREDAGRLARALESLDAGQQMEIKFMCQNFSEHWGVILSALASNDRFDTWTLANNDINGDAGFEVAKAISRAKHVVDISLGNNNMSSGAVMCIAEAALELETLSALAIIRDHPLQLEADAIQALADLRFKFPSVSCGGGTLVRALEDVICAKCIVNPRRRKEVQDGQEELLNKFSAGESAKAAEKLEKLKEKTADPEQKRLLQLMMQLMEKYGHAGGLQLCCTLPTSFPKSKPEPAMREALFDKNKYKDRDILEVQVRQLLATAVYKQPKLVRICDTVEGYINELARRTTTANRVQVVVSAFFEKHDLQEVGGECVAFNATMREGNGRFEQIGYHAGMPAFVMRLASGDRFLYFHHNGVTGWCIAGGLGDEAVFCERYPRDTARKLFTPKAGDIWSHPTTLGVSFGVSMTLEHSKLLLKDGVTEFLTKFLDDSDNMRQWLTLGSDLTKVKYGPPKSFHRAMEKAAEKKGAEKLTDLNRATFVVDSPVVMVLVFHLLEKEVKQEGCYVTRLDNYHFIACTDNDYFKNTGGKLQWDMNRPPCLHLNVWIAGRTYDIIVLLADFATAEELHNFYDIWRATKPEEGLHPVFPPEVPALLPSTAKSQASG